MSTWLERVMALSATFAAVGCVARSDLQEAGRVDACREARATPFGADSIWNTPLGEGLVSHPAGLPAAATWFPIRFIELEDDPITPFLQNKTLGKCDPQGPGDSWEFPFPAKFLTQDVRGNSTAVIIGADRLHYREITQLARCKETLPTVFGLLSNQNEDLRGDGLRGQIGGSFMSALGGTLRDFEIEEPVAIRHPLKLALPLNALFKGADQFACFVPPATTADGCAPGCYEGRDPDLRMGSLVHLPFSADPLALELETNVGVRIAYALQNFGAWVVNNHDPPALFVEHEERTPPPLSDGALRDLGRLMPLLAVAENSRPGSFGGPGERRAVPAAPFCGAASE